jgi:hypothetical protein
MSTRIVFAMMISALMLAGCAADYDKSADAGCKSPAMQAQWELVAPGIMSLGMDGPTKKRLGIANANEAATHAAACKENKPQIQDLKKLGRRHGMTSPLA